MRLNQFPRLLLAEWRKLKLPLSDETIVVAVSGGADSTALLLALEELRRHHKLFTGICVAHLDHRLRKSSSKDAKWVSELASKLGFQSIIGRTKVAEQAQAKSNNLEQAAREARYAFLERTAKKISAKYVLTGHTMDDQAETVLMRLMRGSAGAALGGMEALRPLSKNSSIKLVQTVAVGAPDRYRRLLSPSENRVSLRRNERRSAFCTRQGTPATAAADAIVQ